MLHPDQALNEPAPSPYCADENMEASVMDAVLDQYEVEKNYGLDETVDDRFVELSDFAGVHSLNRGVTRVTRGD